MIETSNNTNYSFLYFGLAAPFLHEISIALAGSLYPEYSHYSSFMSELSANGFEYAYISRLGSLYLSSLCVLLFTLGLSTAVTSRSTLKKWAIGLTLAFGLGRIGAAVFSCDPGCTPESPSTDQVLHNIFGGTGTFCMQIAILLWGIVFAEISKPLSRFSFITGAITLIAFLSISSTLEERNGTGLLQRITISGSHLWVFITALYFLRKRPTTAVVT